MDLREKLKFGEFERIGEERNRRIGGTGQGMSIATQFLELMGGKLEVAFTAPEVQVLVVDDNSMNRKIFQISSLGVS